MSVKTIQQLIDEALVRKPHEKSGKFSPSLFGRCFRLQYWNRKGEPQSNPPDERTLRVFKAGDLFEKFVKDLIIKDGTNWVDCGDEPIESDDVLGFADLRNDVADEIADVKSQHSKSFWYMVKTKDIKKDKRPNWLQVMYYARELKKKFGRLIFISKDDLCIQEYIQPLDNYWFDELEKELTTLRLYWTSPLLLLPPAIPQCEPRKDGTYWECDYCSWKDKCKEIENAKTLS